MNASARKAQAKGTRKCRQVFNLRLLASPFGNGVTQYGLELEGSVSLRANRRKKRDHYAKKKLQLCSNSEDARYYEN